MPVTPFIGQLMPVPYNFAPQGWALCNGQLLSIAQNTALFSLLGTFYGGDGKTTFGLPNLQGNVAIGVGQGTGLSPYNPGDTGGSASITLQLTQLAAHQHGAVAFGRAGTAASPSGADWARTSTDTPYSSSAPNASMSSASTGPTGSGQPHENRQPYLVLNYAIALVGVYPTRP
jgi:microcystin-dependent protein